MPGMPVDLLFILIIILVLVLMWKGPKNLPKLGEALGRGVKEARVEASKAQAEIQGRVGEDEHRRRTGRRPAAAPTAPQPRTSSAPPDAAARRSIRVTPDELAALTHRPTHGPFLTHDPRRRRRRPRPSPTCHPPRDGLLFVGLNPSPVSVEAGHYHQGRLGRTFWRRLMLARILPAGDPHRDRRRGARRRRPRHHRPAQGPDRRATRRPTRSCAPASVRCGRRSPCGDRPRSCSSTSAPPRSPPAATSPEPWGHLEGVALAGRPCVLLPGPYATTEQVDEGINFLRNLVASLPVDRA